VLYDVIITRNLLQRKNIHLPSYNCILCDELHETQHLFGDCEFAQQCWNSILPEKNRGFLYMMNFVEFQEMNNERQGRFCAVIY
jgi:hypothetical protein